MGDIGVGLEACSLCGVYLTGQDPEATLLFYQECLGMAARFHISPGDAKRPGRLLLDLGYAPNHFERSLGGSTMALRLEFSSLDKVDLPPTRSGDDSYILVYVNDVEACQKRLEDHGFPSYVDTLSSYNQSITMVVDPSGWTVRLAQCTSVQLGLRRLKIVSSLEEKKSAQKAKGVSSVQMEIEEHLAGLSAHAKITDSRKKTKAEERVSYEYGWTARIGYVSIPCSQADDQIDFIHTTFSPEYAAALEERKRAIMEPQMEEELSDNNLAKVKSPKNGGGLNFTSTNAAMKRAHHRSSMFGREPSMASIGSLDHSPSRGFTGLKNPKTSTLRRSQDGENEGKEPLPIPKGMRLVDMESFPHTRATYYWLAKGDRALHGSVCLVESFDADRNRARSNIMGLIFRSPSVPTCSGQLSKFYPAQFRKHPCDYTGKGVAVDTFGPSGLMYQILGGSDFHDYSEGSGAGQATELETSTGVEGLDRLAAAAQAEKKKKLPPATAPIIPLPDRPFGGMPLMGSRGATWTRFKERRGEIEEELLQAQASAWALDTALPVYPVNGPSSGIGTGLHSPLGSIPGTHDPFSGGGSVGMGSGSSSPLRASPPHPARSPLRSSKMGSVSPISTSPLAASPLAAAAAMGGVKGGLGRRGSFSNYNPGTSY